MSCKAHEEARRMMHLSDDTPDEVVEARAIETWKVMMDVIMRMWEALGRPSAGN